MILCEKAASLDGAGVRLECAKMKDDEPFADAGHSDSTFSRAWRGLKETDRVRVEKADGRVRIYPAKQG